MYTTSTKKRHQKVLRSYQTIREALLDYSQSSWDKDKGKPNNRVFLVSAFIRGHEGKGRGRSKKEAEEAAAKQVYLSLKREESAPVAQ